MPKDQCSVVPLRDAVTEIVRGGAPRTIDGAYSSPFFFLVGAGVSAPVIPLSSMVEAECRRLVEEEGIKLEVPSGMSPQQSYSYWIEKAHPQPWQQQQYFRGMMEGSRISNATLRLAHLLTSPKTPKLVVTPNFDDTLTRAVRLFGREPVICDHPSTTTRVGLSCEDIRIIHVHGTYWFYDLVNLQDQMRMRAGASESTTRTMKNLLEALLRNHSPIVVGYSGWEGDVIMKCLRSSLGEAGSYAYWFCYSHDDFENLPRWLKEPPAVSAIKFILPDAERDPEGLALSGAEANGGDASSAPLEAERSLLSAETVFEEMLRAWGAGTPSLTTDPIQYFIDQVRGLAPPATGVSAGGPYDFHAVLNKLEELRANAKRSPVSIDSESTVTKAIRPLLETARFDEAVAVARNLVTTVTSDSDRRTLAKFVTDIGQRLREPNLRLEAYSIATRLGRELYATEPGNEEVARQLASALMTYASILRDLGRFAEQLAVYSDIVSLFQGSPLRYAAEWVAQAKYSLARRLGERGDIDAELAAYDEIFAEFSASDFNPVREIVGRSVRMKAARSYQSGREADGDEAVRKLRDYATMPPEWHGLDISLTLALLDKGVYLADKGMVEESLRCYEEILGRFADDNRPGLQDPIARALLNRGDRLEALGRFADARSTRKNVIDRFGGSRNLAVQEVVQKARMKLAALDEPDPDVNAASAAV